ncbi:MAG: hypothetical protein IKW19_08945 [Akkermansia sp.]|nr:hypothetical protein [Akkermansia sp.]
MKQPLYQGNQFASSRVPQQAIESQHPMAGLWQRSAAVAAQAGENIEQALIDRQEFTLRQNREAQLRQATDELNAELAQRLALADGAQGSLFDANGQLNTAAVAEMKKRYGRLSNTWTKGFINPHSVLAATEAQAKYHASLAQQIDSTILSSLKPRALGAYRRNAAAAVAAGDYDGARRINREAYDAGVIPDTDFYLANAEIEDTQTGASLQALVDSGDSTKIEGALYDPKYAAYFQRNPQVAAKIRKQLNQRNQTTPISNGGLRVTPGSVSAGYRAARNIYKPKKPKPAAPATQDDIEQPAEATTEEPATVDAASTTTEDAPAAPEATEATEDGTTETAPPVTEAGGLAPEMLAPVDPTADGTTGPDDGLVPDESQDEAEEAVATTSAHGSATGSISLETDPKAPNPKVKNTPAIPPANSSPYIRDFYQRHGLNFKSPEAQQEAAIHFRKWLLSQPADYLDSEENLAFAQAYGEETLHLEDNIIKDIIANRQKDLSVVVSAFDPKAFLEASTKRWNREYNIKARKRKTTAEMTAADADEEEISAAVAKIEAYHEEASTQLAAIHDKVLTAYAHWSNGIGNKKSPVEQARYFQQLYYNEVKDFKHRRGLGFVEINGVIQNDNTYLDPWVDAPRAAADANLRKAEKDQRAASAQMRADNAKGKANLILRDLNATQLLQRATKAITVYASPEGAGGEVPYKILSAKTDEASAARYVIDASLQAQARTVSFSTAAANSLESLNLPDTNSRYVFYIPETAAQGDPLYAQPNLLLPLHDGGVLNIELRKTKGVQALTPSRALARRLGILGHQYNAITFDGNCLYFLNRYTEQPAAPTLFATDAYGTPTGIETGGYHDAGAASIVNE